MLTEDAELVHQLRGRMYRCRTLREDGAYQCHGRQHEDEKVEEREPQHATAFSRLFDIVTV